MSRVARSCALGALVAVSPTLAAAPQPVRAAPIGMYSGRWYQIAQIAKTNHHPCPGATEDFAANTRGALTVTMTCHSPTGGAHQVRAGVAIVPASGNAKFKMTFFGGLISQEYWLLDHAADQSWALMATPGGNYLWLLTRRPHLDPATRAASVASIQALGYDASRLTINR
jgi:apolipoprotein D and lipocalin family protein